MEQATTGKAPPPIAINSGGGILLNMNAVRAAAVGATVVPSPGSAQTATVVGSPGPPGKAVGPRMLHITPQMLAAANARPGAPGGESVYESVLSCDDELSASDFEQTCAPPPPLASNTGVSSDLQSCDNRLADDDDDECEDGEIRDSDDDKDSINTVKNSTSEDDRHKSDNASDNHIVESQIKYNASEKDLINPSDATGTNVVQVVGSSDNLKERSDSPSKPPHLSVSSPSQIPSGFSPTSGYPRVIVSPGANPDGDKKYKLGRPNQGSKEGLEEKACNPPEKMNCKDSEDHIRLGLSSHSHSSSSEMTKYFSDGANVNEKVGTLYKEKPLPFDVGAQKEIKLERDSDEDRENNNSDAIFPNFCLNDESGNDVPTNDNVNETSEPEKTSELGDNIENEKSELGLPDLSHQKCVQNEDVEMRDPETSISSATKLSSESQCDNDINSGENIESVPVVSDAHREEEERFDKSPLTRTSCQEDVVPNVPDSPAQYPESREGNHSGEEQVEKDNNDSGACPEMNSGPPLPLSDDYGYPRPEADSDPDPNPSPPPSTNLKGTESAMEVDVAPQAQTEIHSHSVENERIDSQAETGNERTVEKTKVPGNDDDTRPQPQLMDMHLADYIFMDMDDDSGHKPWNAIQNPLKSATSHKRPSVDPPFSPVVGVSAHASSSSSALQSPDISPTFAETERTANQAILSKAKMNSTSSSPDSQLSSCAFQIYTIGQEQARSQFQSSDHSQNNNDNSSSVGNQEPLRIAARIPQRPTPYQVHQPPHPFPVNSQSHLNNNYAEIHTSTSARLISERVSSSIMYPNNRANVITNSGSFPPVGESSYKSGQNQQQQRCFTTDPQLHSQFLSYAKNYPVGSQQERVSAMKSGSTTSNAAASSPKLVVPRPQMLNESLSTYGSSSTYSVHKPVAAVANQNPSSYHPQQVQAPTSRYHPVGGQQQHNPHTQMEGYHHNSTLSPYHQQNASYSSQSPQQRPNSMSANGCDNIITRHVIPPPKPPSSYQSSTSAFHQVPRSNNSFAAARLPIRYENSSMPSSQSQAPSTIRQGMPVSASYYQPRVAQGTNASMPDAQSRLHQFQHHIQQRLASQGLQRQPSPQTQSHAPKEFSSCLYNNTSGPTPSSNRAGPRFPTPPGYPSSSNPRQMYPQQNQGQNYASTPSTGSSSPHMASHQQHQTPSIPPNYRGNFSYQNGGRPQQAQVHPSSMPPRPSVPSIVHAMPNRSPSGPGVSSNTGTWSNMPVPSRPSYPSAVAANMRPPFTYTTQNLGRPQEQNVERYPFNQMSSSSSTTAHTGGQSLLSNMTSGNQDQRRTMSVIAPPNYSSSGGGIPSHRVLGPHGTAGATPAAIPAPQRLQSGPMPMMTSPEMLRNFQVVAHYKNSNNSNTSPFGESYGNSSSVVSSVIRPNIYSGGNIITTGSSSHVSTISSRNSSIENSCVRPAYNSSNTGSNSGAYGHYGGSGIRNQASVICGPQSYRRVGESSSNSSSSNNNNNNPSAIGSKSYQVSSSPASSPSGSSSGFYSGELTLQSFLSHPSAPFLCPPSLSPSSFASSPPSERSSGTMGSGYFGNERVWERPYTSRDDQSTDQEQYPLSSCQYSDAMRRYNAPITLQALSGLPPGANHLLVKTENGQFQLVSVRMQSPQAAAAAPGTPVVPSTVAAPPTSMSIAQQLPSNSSLSLPPHSAPSGAPLAPPISSSIITTTTIPPHPSQQGRIITSSSSNHTSWSSSNNNSLVNNNSTTSSPLPIITSSAAHPPPHLVPPSSHPPSSLPPTSTVIMPPNLSASNSQLLISTANNISSSTSSSTFSTAANAAVAAAQAAYNQHRAQQQQQQHPVVVSNVPPPGGPPGPPLPVGAQPTPHPNSIPSVVVPPGSMNSLPPGATVIRTGSLPPPPPPIVVSSATTNSPASNNSAVTSSVVVTSTPNSNLSPAVAPPASATAAFRPQSNTSSQVPNNNATNNAQSSGMRMMMTASNSMSIHPPQHHQIHPPYSQLHPPPLPPHQAPPSYASNNTFASSNTTANTVSQMSNETAKTKCKNFLSFLLELSAKQSATVARNVKNLIQGLIDGKVNEENFADRLQKEVNSQPQPCLVGFLKKSLPHLRHSLGTGELKIEGIKPPTLTPNFVPPAPVSALVPQTTPTPPTPTESRKKPSKQTQPVRPTTPTVPPSPVRITTPPVNSASPSTTPPTPVSASSSGPSATPTTTPSPSSSKSSKTSKGGSSKSKSSAASSNASGLGNSSSSTPSGGSHSKSSIPSLSKSSKEKEKKDKTFSSSGYSADDDINDVAAMGGVNLAEESQRILGSTEYVGTQIRSCRDETLIQASPIIAKYKVIAAKYGLDDTPSPEVSALISHAVEERLKTMVEKLSVIAEHRMDVIKLDERYEITQDVKGQLRFLEELDKLEKKRHDEQEREMLIRAAKSRSKSEDPEQAKLKAKAKEMQRVQMEEMRQRDANLTALQAIGPRKKPKLDMAGGSHGSTMPSPLGATGASSSLGRPQMALRPRLKRVNLRDLLFLLEHDKETMRSPFLYKNLLLK